MSTFRANPERDAVILKLKRRGMRNTDIAREVGCSRPHVCKVIKRDQVAAQAGVGVPVCLRPDVEKHLEPCGKPRHRLKCGALLGVCKDHWDNFKPIANGKTPINGQRTVRRYV